MIYKINDRIATLVLQNLKIHTLFFIKGIMIADILDARKTVYASVWKLVATID